MLASTCLYSEYMLVLALCLVLTGKLMFFVADAPTEVRLGLFVISFYSVSEQTMVSSAYYSIMLGKPPQYFTKPPRPTQSPTLSGRKISTGQSAVTLCGRGVKEGMAHSICGDMYGWQVKCVIPC